MRGLHFCKLDLHTHTPASKCYRNKQHTPEEIVQAALDQGLAGIAVTDHNSAAWIDRMKAAAAQTSLVIFPGVEVTMSDFHLVALFDPRVDQRHVENFLGSIEIPADDYGKQEAFCRLSEWQVMDKIHKANGLAILAHIDLMKGAFYVSTSTDADGKIRVPNTCVRFFNEASYDAVECIAGCYPPGFDMAHGFKRFPAFYQSSDNPDPDEPSKHSLRGIGQKYSWFNLDEITLEGLRQCFADHEVRIRLMGQHTEVSYPRIVSMKVGPGGFLRHQQFEFHHGLNSIIGGKGVGKSLAIEFLRFVLDQMSSDSDLIGDVRGKLSRRLEEGNTVEVVYQTADGTPYLIRRTLQGQDAVTKTLCSQITCTNLSTGEVYTGAIAQMFPVLAYSQTEVIKIAESKGAQLELLDRLVDTKRHEQALQEIEERLRANDGQLEDALRARDTLSSCEQQISTLREQIAAIDRSLANPLYVNLRSAEAKQAAFDSLRQAAQKMTDSSRRWQKDASKVLVPDLAEALTGDAVLTDLRCAVAAACEDVAAQLRLVEQQMVGLDALVAGRQVEWQPELEAITQACYELSRSSGGDQVAQQRKRNELRQQLEQAEHEERQLRSTIADLPLLLARREAMLDDLERAAQEQYATRRAKYDQITRLSNGKLQVRLAHAADRSPFGDALSLLLRGGNNSLPVADRRRIAESMMPRRFVQLVLDRNVDQLEVEAGLTSLWAQRTIEKLWSAEDFTEVLALQHSYHPKDVPDICFKKEGGEYAELAELSVGQKSTALLIIALCDGSMPVIIDQPEDALDIVSVWEDIAKQLRRGKHHRQFILTTHNSSVAVAADSDQFIVMKANARQGKVEVCGAIDRSDVRQEVVKHLEGGDEPYRLRLRKYNLQ